MAHPRSRRLTHAQALYLACAVLIFFSSTAAHAWGRRGHSLVCQTAGYLLATSAETQFLKEHSFDLGYYCNVPDIVWKRPATYKAEWFNHFMDLEIFERGLKDSTTPHPYELDRLAFNAAFPTIPETAGRSFWRIRELEKKASDSAETLRKADLSKEDRHAAQLEWLIEMGTMGHYVGDLAQPLHVTENYDGQMNGQKGIHHFYEETLVDELFGARGSNLEEIVQRNARDQWSSFHKKNEKKTTLELLLALSESSKQNLPTVLRIDKKVGRTDLKKASEAHRETLVARLTQGALYQAELMSRHLGWKFDNDHFDDFASDPAYIAAPAAASAPAAVPAAASDAPAKK